MKFKKLHENAVLPTRSHRFDAGTDLTATEKNVTDAYIEYKTGLAVAIPEGYVGLLCPRSSVTKTGLILGNSLGIIDSGFTGEICLRFKDVNRHLPAYNVGERVGQLVVVPILISEPEFVDELPNSARSSGSFGSTGK